MENVPTAKIIRKDEFGETVKTFDKSTPYESLKPGDVVEVEEETGELRDYHVVDMKWDFTQFGDTLQIIIEPVTMKPTAKLVRFGDTTKHLWY